MHLLYVEDNEDTIEMVKLWLSSFSTAELQVTFARSGLEAMVELASGPHFDGMVLDIALPDVEGPSIVEWARARGLKVPPVVVLSAYSGSTLDAACSRTKAVAGFVKPTSLSVFLQPLGVFL